MEAFKPGLRLQSSMEYLMTYGWAILIISVVLAALWQIGVFNATSTMPTEQPGACRVARQQVASGGTQVGLVGTCNRLLPQFVASFSGTSSNVAIPYSSYLYPQSQVTVSIWVETTASDSDGWVPIVNTAGDSWSCGSYCIRWGSSSIYGAVDTSSGGYGYVYFTQSKLNNGKWHMVTSDYNGVAVQIYLDGAVQSGGPYGAASDSLESNANAVTLGAFSGMLSNVQIYNTSLSANEIASLYFEGIGGAPLPMPNLVGWWPLNGDVKDYSGNNNNGAPTNVVVNSSWSSTYAQP